MQYEENLQGGGIMPECIKLDPEVIERADTLRSMYLNELAALRSKYMCEYISFISTVSRKE